MIIQKPAMETQRHKRGKTLEPHSGSNPRNGKSFPIKNIRGIEQTKRLNRR